MLPSSNLGSFGDSARLSWGARADLQGFDIEVRGSGRHGRTGSQLRCDRYLVTMRPMQSTAGVPPRRVAELVFWAIVGGLRSPKTKEESQPPVRAKVGATWVPCRSENQL